MKIIFVSLLLFVAADHTFLYYTSRRYLHRKIRRMVRERAKEALKHTVDGCMIRFSFTLIGEKVASLLAIKLSRNFKLKNFVPRPKSNENR